jgi:hypothetical protein
MKPLGATLLIALVVAFASDSAAQSKKASDPNPPSSQSAQPAVSDQRGTDKMPLSVKIVPREPSKEEAAKEEAERQAKATIDKEVAFETQRVADYTEYLSVFTLLVVLVAVAQAGLFLWQLGYMKQGMADATKAANSAARSADALVASERARFFIVLERHSLSLQIRAVRDNGRLPLGENVNFTFFFKNYGKTPGILKEQVIGSVIADELPETLLLPLSVKNFPETMIGGGALTPPGNFGPDPAPTSNEIGAIGRNNTRFWFYGRLYYDDVFGDPQVHCFYFRSKSSSNMEECVMEPVEPKGHKKST